MLVVATCPSNLKKCGAKRSRKPTQIHMIPTVALSRLERLHQRAVCLFTVLWLAVKLLPLHASFIRASTAGVQRAGPERWLTAST